MAFDFRLKKEKDFNEVFKNGKRLYSELLSLYFIPSDKTKVGFSVGKKHGGSVKRNRIKRLLRESFRSFYSSIDKNFFFVFIPKVKGNYDFFEIKKNMEYLLIKGGFIKNK